MNNRIIYFDFIRITAILLVVGCHCFGDVSNTSSVLISMLTYLEIPCIGLFIALSGALLLPITPPYTGYFLKKRLSKIVIPAVVWSVVYMFLHNNLTIHNFVEMFFHPVGSGILWFIYVIAGLYVISPIISPWLEHVSHRVLRFYLLIWALTLCFPIFGNWVDVDQSFSSGVYYFSGYLGYFILGFYLKKYGISLKTAALLYVAFLCLMTFIKVVFPQLELYNGSWYLTIFGVTGVIFYWTLLKTIAGRLRNTHYSFNKFIALISNLVFGVYFIHIGLVTYITPEIHIDGLSYLPNYIIKVCVTFIVALFISWLISFSPYADYIIGFKQKQNKSRQA